MIFIWAAVAALGAFLLASRTGRANPWLAASVTGLTLYALLTFLRFCSPGG